MDLVEVLDVAEVDIDPHQVLERPARRLHRGLEACENWPAGSLSRAA
jgi:hypothetical protein